ncbi:synaptobrevin homolog YKT6 [Teleopsis dalmanni]|uniref:synaptobrevin homolog YKT6-like n=1 Tax=Teleopsis dalmanni TaxID=139649 RepID=UPI0018CD9967|nr:synaptobrevin homolog YKT6-like [Teleopsis dalmanni]XP_037936643.1 synaptobrevin homolog YKT6 [Teleopsis dalmanni]
MVKLFSLSVFYKSSSEARLLKSAFDLQSFSFFQRGTVQEFMTFASKTIVERTQPAMRQSVKQEAYMCHVYVRSDNLAGVLIADHEYPQRVAHTLITKILDEFAAKVPLENWETATDSTIDFGILPTYLAKYQDPKEADGLTKIQNDLDETTIILKNTIQAVLERGEKLDDMVVKSENLSLQSKAFYKTAKKTNSCCSFS